MDKKLHLVSTRFFKLYTNDPYGDVEKIAAVPGVASVDRNSYGKVYAKNEPAPDVVGHIKNEANAAAVMQAIRAAISPPMPKPAGPQPINHATGQHRSFAHSVNAKSHWIELNSDLPNDEAWAIAKKVAGVQSIVSNAIPNRITFFYDPRYDPEEVVEFVKLALLKHLEAQVPKSWAYKSVLSAQDFEDAYLGKLVWTPRASDPVVIHLGDGRAMIVQPTKDGVTVQAMNGARVEHTINKSGSRVEVVIR